ncbi:GNAT family N-acetyltransferase [Aurantimicrobium minutum]|uniref:GNAT family N-acetyltransferase n=1 Tax=Aurantimicrobium minutum TaxID=708131 RepID=UPI0024749E8C|nr:GNAT family N-acetyltransferase [Aurantimicrobium minutum]MDH6423813.1 RimJ/RimL family protein N-acetyltransferase [Aurantimicrobium minutum]
MVIRSAGIEDSRYLFEWRNDPTTRNASLNTDEIHWEEHQKWYLSVLKNPQVVIYIAEDIPAESSPLGMCRFNISEERESAEVSINLNPEHRGKGLAQSILHDAIEVFTTEHPRVIDLTATIREENLPSMKIFVSENFVPQHSQDGVVQLKLNLKD